MKNLASPTIVLMVTYSFSNSMNSPSDTTPLGVISPLKLGSLDVAKTSRWYILTRQTNLPFTEYLAAGLDLYDLKILSTTSGS